MKTVFANIDGQLKKIQMERINDTLWLHSGGETYSFKKESRASRGKHKAGAGEPGKVRAPMPGKIIKIMVQYGDSLANGEVVVVLEAMKMEYTLKSNIEGKIKSINCSVGDQVKVDQLLVEISAELEN